MSSTLKTTLKYLLTLGIGIFLLWFLVSKQSPEEQENIVKGFLHADYTWIALTLLISIFEKLIRAYRWNLLLEPLEHHPPLKNTFYSLMTAYLANIFAPRMGEVARCYVLKKTDNVAIESSFGTVVSERAVDFLCLLLLIPFSLLFEYQKISSLILSSVNKGGTFLQNNIILLVILSITLLAILFLLFVYRASLKKNKLFVKAATFVTGVIKSVLSIRRIRKKGQFILCTVLIWVSYFLMTYLAFFSLDATSGLPLSAGLVILIVGGLGMAAPVQGGIGAFHYIVMQTLEEVYKVGGGWALPYAFIVHTSQTALAFFGGLICLILVLSFNQKASTKTENVKLS